MRYVGALYATLRALLVAALAGGAAVAQAQAPSDRETAAWEAARAAGTVEAYQRYLELYPLGEHAGEAFREIIELSTPEDAPPSTIAPAAPPMDVY